MVYECDFLKCGNSRFAALTARLRTLIAEGHVIETKYAKHQYLSNERCSRLDYMSTTSLKEGKITQQGSTTSHQKDEHETNSCESDLADSPLVDRTKIAYLESFLTEGKQVKILPSELFHVVVFSLLLSYFPSAEQRWKCCHKAHQLLRPNGALVDNNT